MDGPGGARDSRFNLGYNMSLLSGESPPEIYGNPNVTLGRPPGALAQQMGRGGLLQSGCGLPRGLKRPGGEQCYDDRAMGSQGLLEQCAVPDIGDDSYTSLQPKKSPPSNGKKTKGRVKIKMEYIDNKLRRYTTFSKRKTGIMKKAYELSTLTGTQVMLLVASETGHVYTFATRKLQPMITSDSGKRLIQTCLNSPDPPQGAGPGHGGDQRMSATGFEETELTYNIADEESKCERSPLDSGAEESGEESGSEPESPGQRQRSPSPDGMNMHRDSGPDGLFGPGGPVLYPPGVILSLAAAAQEQGGSGQPQFITIPLSMAMAAAAASQTTTTAAHQLSQHQQHQQQHHQQQQSNQSNGLQDLSRTGRK